MRATLVRLRAQIIKELLCLLRDEAALQQRRHYHAHCWRLP